MSRIDVRFSFWIGLVLSVMLIPLRWVLAWFLAAVIHELCHILLLQLFHCRIISFRFSAFGAIIESTIDSDISAIICAVAGPIGSLLLVNFARQFPYLAICGFLQGAINLLPLFPFDGWHILERIKSHFSGKVGTIISVTIKVAVCFFLILLGIKLLKNSCGPTPLIIALILISKDLKNSLQKRREEGTMVLLD